MTASFIPIQHIGKHQKARKPSATYPYATRSKSEYSFSDNSNSNEIWVYIYRKTPGISEWDSVRSDGPLKWVRCKHNAIRSDTRPKKYIWFCPKRQTNGFDIWCAATELEQQDWKSSTAHNVKAIDDDTDTDSSIPIEVIQCSLLSPAILYISIDTAIQTVTYNHICIKSKLSPKGDSTPSQVLQTMWKGMLTNHRQHN